MPGSRVSIAHRAAGAVLVAVGVGFGAPVPFVVDHLDRTGELPMTPWGFRAYSGPFESLGPERFKLLAWAFAAVCLCDVVAGLLTWRGDRRGPRLAAGTAPPGVVLGVGFALPIYLASVVLRSILLVAGRR
jgi:hypothetical protein